MTSGRGSKRARKKERRDARREQYRQALKRRRQRRLVVLLSAAVLIGGGVAVAMLAFDDSEPSPTATPADQALDSVTVPIEEPVACGAELPAAAGSEKQLFAEPGDLELDPDATHVLVLETSCGTIEIELDTSSAPETANSVAFLAGEGFYDGTFFHRVAPGFVIQGGDPQGRGDGGSGYSVVEQPPEDLAYLQGIVAMAKGAADPAGSSGSQFFIVTGEEAPLPAEYALVGRVIAGMDFVLAIEETGTADFQPPSAYTYIERATVEER